MLVFLLPTSLWTFVPLLDIVPRDTWKLLTAGAFRAYCFHHEQTRRKRSGRNKRHWINRPPHGARVFDAVMRRQSRERSRAVCGLWIFASQRQRSLRTENR